MKEQVASSRSGFSLIEMLVAMTIFAIGLLGLCALIISSMRVNSQARLISQGTVAAKSRLEQLLAQDYDHASLQDRDGDADPDLGGALGGGLEEAGFDDNAATRGDADYGPVPDNGDLRVYWNVAGDWPVQGSKTIQVIARWRDRGFWKQTSYECVKTNAL